MGSLALTPPRPRLCTIMAFILSQHTCFALSRSPLEYQGAVLRPNHTMYGRKTGKPRPKGSPHVSQMDSVQRYVRPRAKWWPPHTVSCNFGPFRGQTDRQSANERSMRAENVHSGGCKRILHKVAWGPRTHPRGCRTPTGRLNFVLWGRGGQSLACCLLLLPDTQAWPIGLTSIQYAIPAR